MKASIVATGEPVALQALGHIQLNFGQPQDERTTELLVEVALLDLEQALKVAYSNLSLEMLSKPGDFSPDPLLEAGCPPFQAVLRNQEMTTHLFTEYLLFDLLALVAPSTRPRYLIVALSSITVTDDSVKFGVMSIEARPLRRR